MRLTHGGMTARLDQVTTAGSERGGSDASTGRARRRTIVDEAGNGNGNGHGPSDDLDVPEFIPRG